MSILVACCQFAPDVEDPGANAARAREAIAGALDAGARLVVLPELCNSGYVLRSEDEARAAAEPATGELLAGWAAEARGGDALVVGGFCELGDDDRLYNSSALVDGDGVVAVYRKLHLWGEEPRWFVPGDAPAPVVETKLGRIGLGVCYDIEFPELTRGLALGGAELIALPTNWPREADGRRPGGEPMLTVLASATAYLSRLPVAVCDRCGVERGLEFQGGSVIAGPDGAVLAGPVSARGEGTLIAEVSTADARDKRTGQHNDAFADRRAASYSPLLLADSDQ